MPFPDFVCKAPPFDEAACRPSHFSTDSHFFDFKNWQDPLNFCSFSRPKSDKRHGILQESHRASWGT